MLLVIDSRYFDSVIVTSMRDDVHSDYGGETLQELRDRYSNPYLITVTPERIAFMLKRYDKALSQPFEEISQERYYDLMDCVPPKRFSRNRFFVGEAYSGTMYDLCFRLGDRYFKALRDIRLSDEDIDAEISRFAKKLKQHPKIIKGEAIRNHNGWHNRIVMHTPYYFQLGKRKLFLCSLTSDSGNKYDDRRYRREMAERLLNLRKNRYEYCTFYSRKSDIFEFFKWLRENHYTLEVHGSLFSIDPDRGYVDFHGNVCEYSAAFHYRIYSRELFENIIHQLRRVKRHRRGYLIPKIMYQIDKLRIIESDAVPKEGAKIEVLSTSIKITHTCGCVLVEHFAAGEPNMRREEDPEKYDRLLAERKYFIELCNEHKNCK